MQGPAASGLGAIQQFFEALGLTAPPKVEISTKRIDLTGNPGEQLQLLRRGQEPGETPGLRPRHQQSSRGWKSSRAKLNGRVAVINLSVPSVPNREGETLTAKLTVQSNGNQRFVVPVTLQIGDSLVFGAAGAGSERAVHRGRRGRAVRPAGFDPPVVSLPLAVFRQPIAAARSRSSRPGCICCRPCLLFLALLIAVVVDLLWQRRPRWRRSMTTSKIRVTRRLPGRRSLRLRHGPSRITEPRLTVRFDEDMNASAWR